MHCVGSMLILHGRFPMTWCPRAGPPRHESLDCLWWHCRTGVWRPPTLPLPLGPNDGESEVGVSDEELPPSPARFQGAMSDNMEHILDKGCGLGLGLCGGAEDLRQVRVFLLGLCSSLISRVQDKLMTWAPICQCVRHSDMSVMVWL